MKAIKRVKESILLLVVMVLFLLSVETIYFKLLGLVLMVILFLFIQIDWFWMSAIQNLSRIWEEVVKRYVLVFLCIICSVLASLSGVSFVSIFVFSTAFLLVIFNVQSQKMLILCFFTLISSGVSFSIFANTEISNVLGLWAFYFLSLAVLLQIFEYRDNKLSSVDFSSNLSLKISTLKFLDFTKSNYLYFISLLHSQSLFIFFLLLSVVFWLLPPGFIISLDLIPVHKVSWGNLTLEISSYSHLLSILIENIAGLLLGTVLAQKVFLLSLFFGIIYLPLIYFPNVGGEMEAKIWKLVRYMVAIFYTVNPFVWERFLAGQWGVLAGYALLWPFVYYLVEFTNEVAGTSSPSLKEREPEGEDVFAKLFIATFLVGAVSFHFLVMCFVILFFTFIYLLILNRYYFITNFKKLFLVVGVFVLASSYWIVPTVWNMYNNEYVVQGFGGADREAFMTSVYGESEVTKVLNIFNLYGFWGERHPWAQQFDILPNANCIVFLPVLIVMLLGIIVLIRRNWKVGGIVLGGVVLSAIFSLGVADTVFKPVNEWLFNNVFFWNGFRDSQKWTGMMIVFMSVGLGMGLSFVLEKIYNLKYIQKKDVKKNLGMVFLCVVTLWIVLYTPNVLTGFSDKLRPVDYPATWYEANEVIENNFELEKESGRQENCAAIFLPWHMYYYLGFNNNLLTANPAQKFFDCKTYTSLDPEIGEVGVGVVKDKKALAIHNIMIDFNAGNLGYADAVEKLRAERVGYIIFTSDTLRKERFLNPKNVFKVEQIYDSADIAVFKI